MNKTKKINLEWLAEDGIVDIEAAFNAFYNARLKQLQSSGCYGMSEFIQSARIAKKYLTDDNATYASIAREEGLSNNCVCATVHTILFEMKRYARERTRESRVIGIFNNLDSIEKLAKQVVSPRRAGCQILDCVAELRNLLIGVNL